MLAAREAQTRVQYSTPHYTARVHSTFSRSFVDDGALAEVIACALAHERVELVQEDGGWRVVARHLKEHLHVHRSK